MIPPRGLSRSAAAAYLGISPDLFDRGIVEGVLPHFTAGDRKRGAGPSNDNSDAPLSAREAWLAGQK